MFLRADERSDGRYNLMKLRDSAQHFAVEVEIAEQKRKIE
jgi:hypothetical protein